MSAASDFEREIDRFSYRGSRPDRRVRGCEAARTGLIGTRIGQPSVRGQAESTKIVVTIAPPPPQTGRTKDEERRFRHRTSPISISRS